ncbi:MAG: preprotein translocase subunit SecA [Cytophagales bacterium]|nr:preprotein translocase subunit SecA [Cytophagales bacterium]
MFDVITRGVAKVFGTKADRDLKDLTPYVGKINAEYEKLTDISDDELRASTQDLKDVIAERLKVIDDQINSLQQQVRENPSLGIHEKEEIFDQIDKLEEDRDTELEEVLIDILPKAFAVVKETSRRLAENKQLVVTASDKDREYASTKDHVTIENGKAIWGNEWTAAGTDVVWNMVHYDVQLIGGVVLHQGKIAEMATGEGKTLVATLPAYLNALAGRGVHVVTVNDYLARRDSEWNAPIFQFHGLTVSCIDIYESNSDERAQAYKADIIYGTNNEFGFDYLRDNMTRDPEELVQGKHHFAMVDEVDSVLVDEARTPLIISGPIPQGSEHEFDQLKPRIQKLVDAQKKLLNGYLTTAKKELKAGNEKDGGLPLFRAYRGMPKHKPLIKFLSEEGIRQTLQKTENYYLADNQKLMPEADDPLFFTIDEKNNSIELTEKGIDLITGTGEDSQFFILPDIGEEINKLESATTDEDGKAIAESDRLRQKDELIKDYNTKSKRIHSVNQLLRAYCLYDKDVEYIVVEDKVKIVDEQTGRVMEGRRYSDGLHQAIEAKENVKVEDATQTYATVTLQNYFRMYHKLAGMTGTAETEAGEFWDIYKLDVVVIPTNRPIQRDDREDKIYRTIREKYSAVAKEIAEMTEQRRPVLVGTTSVEVSELLSKALGHMKIKHQVLNAKQHAREADVVAEAGKPGTVTIATNMAGRGTDIKLTEESRAAGGLAIIGTERHESRRVDRQLRGRSGRQGDVGSSQFFVSMEDNLMRLFGFSDRIAKVMDRIGLKEGEVIQHSMITKSIEKAQKKVEENNFAGRKRLLEFDDVMNAQREVIYSRRRNALYGERLKLDIMNMVFDTCEDIALNAKMENNLDSLRLTCFSVLSVDLDIDQEQLEKISQEDLTKKLYDETFAAYNRKNEVIVERVLPVLRQMYEEIGQTESTVEVPFTNGVKAARIRVNLKKAIDTEGEELILALEKMSSLQMIDMAWMEHLREMDDLKQSVQNAVYEQKDPLIIYKFEGFELFKQFIGRVNEDIVSFLTKCVVPVERQDSVQVARRRARRQKSNLNESKEESKSLLDATRGRGNRPPAEKVEPVKVEKNKGGRNAKVTVRYADGSTKTAKYKQVEKDIQSNKCVIIEE